MAKTAITKKITNCWDVDNNSIVVSCPSSRGGNYLVGVSKIHDNILVVAHSCPAMDRGYGCWHNKAAVEAFYEWHWWEKENKLKIKFINKKVVLSPEWEQISIPGTIPEEILELWG